MEETQEFLFKWSFACVLLFGIIASVAIINLSYEVGAASLIWLGLARLFTHARKNMTWLR